MEAILRVHLRCYLARQSCLPEDIYLSFDSCNCGQTNITWIELPGGADLGPLGPGAKMQNEVIVPVKLNTADPVPVELYVRNRRGAMQNVLGVLYRDKINGGPAFHKGMTNSS